ncbi:hypothetical protein HDU91_004987, partial [Kappamyces sp. JEL0680]
MEEERSLVYLQDNPKETRLVSRTLVPDFKVTLTPSTIMLFRFSALTFNSHMIHYDLDYARNREGYDHVLVHGPLTTTLLLDFVKQFKPTDRVIGEFEYSCTAPIYPNQPLTLNGRLSADTNTFVVWASNHLDSVVAKGTASLKTLVLPTRDTVIKVFKLDESEFRLVLVDVPGPLVSCSIVVPTVCSNHKGLPHTLEHLIFCGSINHPSRGFLDNLAVRCCSTGTNAYTSEDHTCYELTTAGGDGMLECFPVFLDHVLNPTLLDSQFLTEVYCIDGEGKQQGVVFCEMAARENTEADLLDRALREIVYQQETTYSFECGGLTPEVAKLSNAEIIAYHKQFYHIDNTTAIICGQLDSEKLFAKLSQHSSLFEKTAPMAEIQLQVHQPLPLSDAVKSKTIHFASEDEEVGSIGYAWPGPPSEDVKTIIALEVLFRYFNDNPSSLLPQAFIERPSPLASDIDLDIKAYVDSPVMWIFSGIPRTGLQSSDELSDGSDSGSELDSESGADSEMDAESADDADDSDDVAHLFEPGVFRQKVHDCIQRFIASGFTAANGMIPTIQRHRRKIQESLEESPHEMVAMNLIPDVLRYSLGSKSLLNDTKRQNGKPTFGLRLRVFAILDELERESNSYWTGLAEKYLSKETMLEVVMIPDATLARTQTETQLQDDKSRADQLGKSGLDKLAKELAQAVEDNKVSLTSDLIASMPPIPDVSKAPKIRLFMENVGLGHDSLFSTCQVVKTETSFLHVGLAFNISSIPPSLKPYLVLFQELLFQSTLEIPASNGSLLTMDFQEVSRYTSSLFVSHECGVGFGNSIFSTSYLSQILTFFGTSIPADFERMVRFMAQVIMFTKFTGDRILSIAKNLVSNLIDTKRDGQSVLDA